MIIFLCKVGAQSTINSYQQSSVAASGLPLQQQPVQDSLRQQQQIPEATVPQQQQQQQQKSQKEDVLSGLGKAALGGAFGATALGQAVGAVKEEDGDKEEPTVAEELAADVAEAATGAVLDAVKSGEFDAEALGK